MYYTHGDTVIYRSDGPEGNARRHRPPELEREPRRSQPAVEEVLARRVAELEGRLARLEAELAEARAAAADRLARPVLAPGGRPVQAQAGGVKVSIHAEGGAQATVGQVRMISDD